MRALHARPDCSAVALLAEHKAVGPSYATPDVASAPVLTDVEISERMSGNICRCSDYSNIVAAWACAC